MKWPSATLKRFEQSSYDAESHEFLPAREQTLSSKKDDAESRS